MTPSRSVTWVNGSSSSASSPNGAPAKPPRQAPLSTRGSPVRPVRRETVRMASRAAGGGAGSNAPFHAVKTRVSVPPRRSTRPSSATARRASNQWNASATNAASTDASASGIASAVPASQRAAGTVRSPIRRIPSSGSTQTTSANRGSSTRASLPVPAARSSTTSPATPSATPAGHSGRPRS